MGHISWLGSKTRVSGILRLAAAFLTAVVLSVAITSGSTQAATSPPKASPLKVFSLVGSRQAVADIANGPYFAVYKDTNCTVDGYLVYTTSNHSAWENFNVIGLPYHPMCVIDYSGSSVWLEDEAVEDSSNICLFTDQGVQSPVDQYGWFFVTYGVDTCGSSEPGGE
jgi:hypothetical protein